MEIEWQIKMIWDNNFDRDSMTFNQVVKTLELSLN